MLYVTGDTHGNFERFRLESFPNQEEMDEEDFVLICGDFGGVWDGKKHDQRQLSFLKSRPFTTLWVDGNHENYDRLRQYPIEEWHGGKIQRINSHVIHLMRGQVFEIEGHTFFTMGGAASHDIDDGILNPYAPDFEEQYWMLRRMGAYFRVNHISWWKEELPNKLEYNEALRNLERANWNVDYIITHCAPTQIEAMIGKGGYVQDHLTDFLDEVAERTSFIGWYFGHYHFTETFLGKYHLLYQNIIRLL